MSHTIYKTKASTPLKWIMTYPIVRLTQTVEPKAHVNRLIVDRSHSPQSCAPFHAGASVGPSGDLHRHLIGDVVVDSYKPRTKLGQKLLAIRKAFLADGGKLLSQQELDAEVTNRKGGSTVA